MKHGESSIGLFRRIRARILVGSFSGKPFDVYRAVHRLRDNEFFFAPYSHEFFEWVDRLVQDRTVESVRRLLIYGDDSDLRTPDSKRILKFHEGTNHYDCRVLHEADYRKRLARWRLPADLDLGIFGISRAYRGRSSRPDFVIGTWTSNSLEVSRLISFFDECWSVGRKPRFSSLSTMTVSELFSSSVHATGELNWGTDMSNLKGRSVLVTGGTGSVGQALIAAFARAEAEVSFQYYENSERAKAIGKKFGAKAIPVDFFKGITAVPADFDILVNNAGINISKRITEDTGIDEWNQTIQLNTTVPFLLAKLLLPRMRERGFGRIVNISSIFGFRAGTQNLAYNVSKHGLSALTKTIAKEYGKYGITCNEICPGPIESELLNRIAEENSANTGIPASDYLNQLRSSIPVGRLATPEDVADCAVFLASNSAQYLNGVSIAVDGGLTV